MDRATEAKRKAHAAKCAARYRAMSPASKKRVNKRRAERRRQETAPSSRPQKRQTKGGGRKNKRRFSATLHYSTTVPL